MMGESTMLSTSTICIWAFVSSLLYCSMALEYDEHILGLLILLGGQLMERMLASSTSFSDKLWPAVEYLRAIQSNLIKHTYTMRCRSNAVNFRGNHHKWHSIARTLGGGMGCLLTLWGVFAHSDWYSASVTAVMYAMACNIGPRYNGARLYLLIHCVVSWWSRCWLRQLEFLASYDQRTICGLFSQIWLKRRTKFHVWFPGDWFCLARVSSST